jgi:hypothetical protein
MVNVYVSVIAAVAGIAGATISQALILICDAQQAKRDRQERQAAEQRQACLDLLRAAVGLRTQVANNVAYQGTGMRELLAQVREHTAAAQVHAVSVAILDPGRFAEPADRLAAASSLAASAEANTQSEARLDDRRPGSQRAK